MTQSLASERPSPVLDRIAIMPQSMVESLRSPEASTSQAPYPVWMSRLMLNASTQGLATTIHRMLAPYGALTMLSQTAEAPPQDSKKSGLALSLRWNEMPSFPWIDSATLVEIQLYRESSARRTPALPIDCFTAAQLRKKLIALRQLARNKIPIGVAIPKGNVVVDIPWLLETTADFITLVSTSTTGTQGVEHGNACLDPWMIRCARRLCEEFGHPHLPLYVEACVRDGTDIAKCMALGATSIILDPILLRWNQESSAPRRETFSGGGLLSEIGGVVAGPATASREAQVAVQLKKCWNEMENGYASAGLSVGDTRIMEKAIALDEPIARQLGIPLLTIPQGKSQACELPS